MYAACPQAKACTLAKPRLYKMPAPSPASAAWATAHGPCHRWPIAKSAAGAAMLIHAGAWRRRAMAVRHARYRNSSRYATPIENSRATGHKRGSVRTDRARAARPEDPPVSEEPRDARSPLARNKPNTDSAHVPSASFGRRMPHSGLSPSMPIMTRSARNCIHARLAPCTRLAAVLGFWPAGNKKPHRGSMSSTHADAAAAVAKAQRLFWYMLALYLTG